MDEDKILGEIEKVSKTLTGFKTELGEKVSKSDYLAATKAVEELKAAVGKIEAEKLSETLNAIKTQVGEMKENVDKLRESSKKIAPAARQHRAENYRERGTAFLAAGCILAFTAAVAVDQLVTEGGRLRSPRRDRQRPSRGRLTSPRPLRRGRTRPR